MLHPLLKTSAGRNLAESWCSVSRMASRVAQSGSDWICSHSRGSVNPRTFRQRNRKLCSGDFLLLEEEGEREELLSRGFFALEAPAELALD